MVQGSVDEHDIVNTAHHRCQSPSTSMTHSRKRVRKKLTPKVAGKRKRQLKNSRGSVPSAARIQQQVVPGRNFSTFATCLPEIAMVDSEGKNRIQEKIVNDNTSYEQALGVGAMPEMRATDRGIRARKRNPSRQLHKAATESPLSSTSVNSNYVARHSYASQEKQKLASEQCQQFAHPYSNDTGQFQYNVMSYSTYPFSYIYPFTNCYNPWSGYMTPLVSGGYGLEKAMASEATGQEAGHVLAYFQHTLETAARGVSLVSPLISTQKIKPSSESIVTLADSSCSEEDRRQMLSVTNVDTIPASFQHTDVSSSSELSPDKEDTTDLALLQKARDHLKKQKKSVHDKATDSLTAQQEVPKTTTKVKSLSGQDKSKAKNSATHSRVEVGNDEETALFEALWISKNEQICLPSVRSTRLATASDRSTRSNGIQDLFYFPRPSSRRSQHDDDDCMRFKVNDIVWAKMVDRPWWPAKIISFMKEDRTGKQTVPLVSVKWLGRLSSFTEVLPTTLISSFAETFHKHYLPNKKESTYVRAITEAFSKSQYYPIPEGLNKDSSDSNCYGQL